MTLFFKRLPVILQKMSDFSRDDLFYYYYFFFGEHLRTKKDGKFADHNSEKLCTWSFAVVSSNPLLGLKRVCSRKVGPWPRSSGYRWVISGYTPESNHVFALLISMPPEFSLMPRYKSINFYQISRKLSYFCQKIKNFRGWGLCP